MNSATPSGALLDADEKIYFAADTVVGDNRLLARLETARFLVRPLLAVVIATRLALLFLLALFVPFVSVKTPTTTRHLGSVGLSRFVGVAIDQAGARIGIEHLEVYSSA